jgi:XTP/dITP diphosphohydrolase
VIELVLATNNEGKRAEFARLLEGLPVRLCRPADFGLGAPEESGQSFVENALLKARLAARRTGRPALADDSGLLVEALGGAPGLLSARYGGEGLDDRARVALLLRALEGVPATARRARFHCALAYVEPGEDPAPLVVTGEWHGLIADAPRGEGGFGYDPVFLDPTLGRTAAELSAEEKQRLSHRGRAMALLRPELARRLGERQG